jgi:hypothetical protein
LPDSTVDALRQVLELRAAEPHPLLTAGQRARVRTGPFAGLEGVVVRSKSNFRVVITVAHIMQSFSVEVDRENLQPLSGNDRSDFSVFAA